jgi:hypothetical protein
VGFLNGISKPFKIINRNKKRKKNQRHENGNSKLLSEAREPVLSTRAGHNFLSWGRYREKS